MTIGIKYTTNNLHWAQQPVKNTYIGLFGSSRVIAAIVKLKKKQEKKKPLHRPWGRGIVGCEKTIFTSDGGCAKESPLFF